jgi:hypothetical protein
MVALLFAFSAFGQENSQLSWENEGRFIIEKINFI